ncbi:histidine kinase [Clostridium autoethanogenum]|uniref:Stage 0 sporulation protein A homolog n=1 Tax=Clostridium autoethanogenum TaxID=84023 RepID=A0A3M0SVF9_9CLOT|nr:histidine kinase [Clostridium autoethanogenum]RMD02296.1 histidine kinase [Clostridium autoethanogenum]
MIIIKFLIVSEDQSISSILSKIIQDHNLGETIEYSCSQFISESYLLNIKAIDILIVSLPIAIVNKLISKFDGKIIVVSDINDKTIIAQAYLLGVEYYITKPINELEIVEVIKKVVKLIKLQKYMYNIKNILNMTGTKT